MNAGFGLALKAFGAFDYPFRVRIQVKAADDALNFPGRDRCLVGLLIEHFELGFAILGVGVKVRKLSREARLFETG